MSKLSFEQILNKENNLIYDVKGISMLPLLKEGKCQVHIVPSDTYELYDIVLYKISKKTYILHRIIYIKNDEFVILGDNSFRIDILKKEDILGKMVGYYEDNSYISINDDQYKKYLERNVEIRAKEYNSIASEGKCYFVNLLKEMYYEVLRFEYDDSYELNTLLLNNQTDIIKKAFYKCLIRKKASHVFGAILLKYNLNYGKEVIENSIREYEKAKYLFSIFNKAEDEISNAFDQNGINHIFLKGSEIRGEYKNPVFRKSQDIDIFVSKDDLEKARQVLKSIHFEYYSSTVYHDVFISKKYNLSVEMHYAINSHMPKDKQYLLDNPLEDSVVDKDKQHLYHMTPSKQYLFHLTHLIKHIGLGDCWSSMLIDTFIYNQKYKNFISIVQSCGLYDFYNHLNKITSYIFDKKQDLDDLTKKVEIFIFNGNTDFGNKSIKEVHGSYFKYCLWRLFPGFQIMTFRYPILKKVPILLPFCYIIRFFAFFFRKDSILNEKERKTRYKNDIKEQLELLKEIGLYDYIIQTKRENKNID